MPSSVSPVRLSVVIVTYNSSDRIAACLRSVLAEGGPGLTIDVVAVDNASSDGTSSAIRTHFPTVRLIENPTNAGFAVAANQGFHATNDSLVLFLNPDTVVEDGALRLMAGAAIASPNVGAVGCALVDGDGNRQRSCWKEPTLMTALLESFLPHRFSLPLVTEQPATPADVAMVSGACMMVRREVFEQLGGFDPGFFMFYEDADLCLRARERGLRILYLPDARVCHTVSRSFGRDMRLFYLHVYRSKLRFFRKHRSTFRAAQVKGILIAGIAVRVPAYYLAGRLFGREELLRLAKCHTFVLPKMINA